MFRMDHDGDVQFDLDAAPWALPFDQDEIDQDEGMAVSYPERSGGAIIIDIAVLRRRRQMRLMSKDSGDPWF